MDSIMFPKEIGKDCFPFDMGSDFFFLPEPIRTGIEMLHVVPSTHRL